MSANRALVAKKLRDAAGACREDAAWSRTLLDRVLDEMGEIDIQDLCKSSQEEWKRYERSTPDSRLLVHPPARITFGGKFGRQQFKYRLDDGDDNLIEHTDREWSWKLGAGGSYLVPVRGSRLALSWEGLLYVEQAWTAATATARWCTPVGQVARKVAEGEPAASDPAESCTEATLGAPKRSRKLGIEAYLGIVEARSDFWRVAVGPTFQADLQTGDLTFGFALPIWLNFASAELYEGKYNGLLQIVPAVEWYEVGGGDHMRAMLKIALLGQRSLFSSTFDTL